jgi:AcrR family transcriptional regulator
MVALGSFQAHADAGGRDRILREARLLFTNRGYAAVSMQQIADAVGINKATLYHHFRDKDDLFVSVMAEEFRRMTDGVTAAIAEGQTLREQLTRVASHFFAVRHTDFGRLSADLREHVSEARRAELMARCAPPWDQVRAAVDRAILAGEARDIDAELVSRLFFAMVGSQVWWSKFGVAQREPDADLAEAIADLVINGVATRAGETTPSCDERGAGIAGGPPAIGHP